MPSWITHLVTATKISKNNEYIFANLMPDILQKHIIKDTSKRVNYETTHYTKIEDINGIDIPMPDINTFYNTYKNEMNNPIISGYYSHLLTDYFWNEFSYKNYFKQIDQEKNLIQIKLANGEKVELLWDDAVKLKQKDFRKFTQYLHKNMKMILPVYSDKILKYSKALKEYSFEEKDIKNTIKYIDEYINKRIEETTQSEYQIFSEELMKSKFEESIEFIKNHIKG